MPTKVCKSLASAARKWRPFKEFPRTRSPETRIRQSRAQPSQTFADLTSIYSLTCDPDQSTSEAYMNAAIQASIPNAFIVGKDGKIEWIGHPARMDGVLRAVVDGSWKRDEFGKDFLALQTATKARAELNAALQRRDYDKAIELIDARVKASEQPQEQLELRLTKIQISLAKDNMPEAAAQLQDTFAYANGRSDIVDLVCWHIFEQSEQRKNDMSVLVSIALAEGEKALGKAKVSPAQVCSTPSRIWLTKAATKPKPSDWSFKRSTLPKAKTKSSRNSS